jgi:hypothetical protein
MKTFLYQPEQLVGKPLSVRKGRPHSPAPRSPSIPGPKDKLMAPYLQSRELAPLVTPALGE